MAPSTLSSVLTPVLPSTAGGFAAAIVVLLVSYQLSIYAYNLFFHPLARFPGPRLAAASCLPRIRHSIRGDINHWIVDLHREYGHVVRVSPNELSFDSADAWKDVHGHKKAGLPTLPKDPDFYRLPGEDVTQLVSAEFDVHSRQRRIFSHAFSDRALKAQEPLFLVYVNKLVAKLREAVTANPDEHIDMVKMYNLTTFDVMGDLTFGEPLDMLENSDYHPWVSATFSQVELGVYFLCIRFYPALANLLLKLVPSSIREKRDLHHQFSRTRVDRRMEKTEARPDIWGLVLAKEGQDSGLSREEMYANSEVFMIAGTETTATLLSGLTYYLLRDPDRLAKLTSAIRSEFATEDDITIERLQGLQYLNACVEEGLRMFPPVPVGLPRIVPSEGATIAGHEVPANAKVSVTHLAAYRNPDNFKDAYSFIPERWLPENTEFASDKKHALQPFSLGPRGCLGKNMAYHEIRLILSKILYHFDLELCPESENWLNMRIMILWEKGPLYCRLKPVRR